MTDIEKLLEGRKVVDAYREVHADFGKGKLGKTTHADLGLELTQGLQELGFAIGEFFEFDKQMKFNTFKEYRPFYGECDFCEGYEDTPPCKALYGNVSCYATKQQATKEKALRAQLNRYQQGIHKWSVSEFLQEAKVSKGKYYSFCPPGHGYYGLVAELKEFPFDMSWR